MASNADNELAANLAWLIEKLGATQSSLAAKAGIGQTTVGRILAATNSPSVSTLAALAAVCRVEPWQLLAPRLGADLYRITAGRVVPVIVADEMPRPLERRSMPYRYVRGGHRAEDAERDRGPATRKPTR